MAKYRKLGKDSAARKALIRNQVTALIQNDKIVTTLARAKEVQKQVEKLIALAVREADNFETVTVSAKVAKKDANGKRLKEVVDGKTVYLYDTVEKEVKRDSATKLAARKQMNKVLYVVTDVPKEAAGKKRNTKRVDLTNKLFDDIAPRYKERNGGYTRIIKVGPRRGDGETVNKYMDEALAAEDLEESYDLWKKAQWDGAFNPYVGMKMMPWAIYYSLNTRIMLL